VRFRARTGEKFKCLSSAAYFALVCVYVQICFNGRRRRLSLLVEQKGLCGHCRLAKNARGIYISRPGYSGQKLGNFLSRLMLSANQERERANLDTSIKFE